MYGLGFRVATPTTNQVLQVWVFGVWGFRDQGLRCGDGGRPYVYNLLIAR